MAQSHTEQIRALNDRFRTTFQGGRVLLTSGIDALGQEAVAAILNAVRTFAEFTRDNDPHGEHDFGGIRHDGCTVFWKIDYYDAECRFGSEDPADPGKTTRILTVMLAEEY